MDIEDDLRAVLVCEAKNRRPRFDVVDGRIRSVVDNPKELLECFWGLIDINDRELWGLSGRWLWKGKHIYEDWRRDG